MISSHQVLPYMKSTNDIGFYDSEYIRTYFKTGKGLYFRELKDKTKENDFIKMMMNHVLKEITQILKLNEFAYI